MDCHDFVSGILQNIMIPVFGNMGIKGAFSLGYESSKAKVVLGLLGISPHAVANHLRYVRNRMEETTTAQAILVALITGEFRPEKES